MSKLTKLLGAAATVFTLYSGLSYAQSASTDYTYDARGRLVKVENASGDVDYNYDDAGNRTSVTATSTPPSGGGGSGPTIDSFQAPANVNSGELFSVSWQSSDATSCQITVTALWGTSFRMANSSITTYPNLQTSGSKFFQITQNSSFELTCTDGSQSDSATKFVDVGDGCGAGACES